RARFEDANAAIAYTDGWNQNQTDDPFSGTSGQTGIGTAAASGVAGAQATFAFSGTGVSWIGSRGPSRGIARVYVDGVPAAAVDTFAASVQPQAVLFTAPALDDASHTITVEATGEQNPSSTRASVVVDAFDVSLSSPLPSVAR